MNIFSNFHKELEKTHAELLNRSNLNLNNYDGTSFIRFGF